MIRLSVIFCMLSIIGFSQGITIDDIFSKKGLRLIGGFTFSNTNGEGDSTNIKYTPGFKFGAEKLLSGNILGGISYTQRGWKTSYKESDYSGNNIWTLNYITTYITKQFTFKSVVVYAGAEIGYFWNANVNSNSRSNYNNESHSDYDAFDKNEWKNIQGNIVDYGLLLGAIYSYNEKVDIVGSYYYGIPKLFNDEKFMNRSIQIFISYAMILLQKG